MSAIPLRRRDDAVSRWVCFRLGAQLYGLPILQVQELLGNAAIEPVPGTTNQVCGVINLRGNVVTVLDLRVCLGLSPGPDSAESRIVVVEHGTESVGLRVDGVAEVRKVIDGAIRPSPNVGSASSGGTVRGVYLRDGEMLTLLDPDAVVNGAQCLSER
ncbi:chemotaxis protein CheW [Sinimarinibacterium sp. CAU 1509]|uniref:chemotaxis protein CheW n=1 Tax=Sinimarinibacterium sp. CAU 1509 TaxID=2562283 RepID=UPI0010AB5F80|nr:chemotaxis protein CheW [Sinimarinibacterium sp. CAU 1509]TJY62832.1 chemotaxis protein CheW [Sinimarinibacterium sp. CAU 1509]